MYGLCRKTGLLKKRFYLLFFLQTLCMYSVLAQIPEITIATLHFPPISDETLENGGFVGELFQSIFQNGGYRVNINFYPWARGYEMSRQGTSVSGIFPSIYSEEREQLFYFSDKIITSNYVLVTRKDTGINTYNSLNEFRNRTIGILRGGVTGSPIDGSEFRKEEGTDFETNLRKLLAGRYDLITGEYLTIINAVNTSFPGRQDEFMIIYPPISKVEFHLMISRTLQDAPSLLGFCNRGIAEIKANGQLDALLKKYGIYFPRAASPGGL